MTNVMTRTIQTIVAALFISLLAGCGDGGSDTQAQQTSSNWRDEVTKLRIGFTGSERDTQRMSRLQQYADHLSNRLGIPVSFVLTSDYSGMVQAISAKQVEMAIIGASGYANMLEVSNGNVEPLVTNIEADGSMGYYSAVIVRADSPYQKIEDLEGTQIGWADANSTSGYLFPRHALRQRGIDPDAFFDKQVFAGGHPQGIISVIRGQNDVGVTWVSGVGDVNTGYTRGWLQMMSESGQIDMADLRVIELLGPIPNGPTVIRKDLPQELKDLVRGILTAMAYEAPETYEAVAGGSGNGYIGVSPDFYQVVIDMRTEEKETRRGK